MIVDGKKIAEEIKKELKQEIKKSGKMLRLAIAQTANGDKPSAAFVALKKKFAEEIGIETRVYEIPADISAGKLREKMAVICHAKQNDGVIIQLPLPKHINLPQVLNSIPPKKDVDVLSSRAFGDFVAKSNLANLAVEPPSGKDSLGGSTAKWDGNVIFPPVVGAVHEIFKRHNIEVRGKMTVVIGAGILVGRPVSNWLIGQGASVSVLNEFTPDISKFTKEADIVISGAGKACLVTTDMVKDGVVAIDVGTSEANGKVSGDIDKKVAEKASLFAGVPGGVGPITVAMLFRNLLKLKSNFQ